MDAARHECLKVREVDEVPLNASSRAYELVADGGLPAAKIGATCR